MASSRPNGVLLLALYLAAAVLTGALLAPWLFKLGKWYVDLAASFRLKDTRILGLLAEKCRDSDFTRYFNRAFLVSALFWLWPFSKWAGVRRVDLGLVKNRFRWQDGSIGFILGSGVLLALGFILVIAGRFSGKSAAVGSVFLTATLSAVFVALFEEFFFRGALFGLLLRTLRGVSALLFLSFFFAIVHLLQPPNDLAVSDSAVHAGTGFWLTGVVFSRFGNAEFLLAEFATLFILGLVLGWARLKTQSLWLSIGIHGGLVFALKFFAGITTRGTLRNAAGEAILDGKGKPKLVDPDKFLPWIGQDLKIGAAPLIALIVLGMLTVAWLALRKKALAARPVGRDSRTPVAHADVGKN